MRDRRSAAAFPIEASALLTLVLSLGGAPAPAYAEEQHEICPDATDSKASVDDVPAEGSACASQWSLVMHLWAAHSLKHKSTPFGLALGARYSWFSAGLVVDTRGFYHPANLPERLVVTGLGMGIEIGATPALVNANPLVLRVGPLFHFERVNYTQQDNQRGWEGFAFDGFFTLSLGSRPAAYMPSWAVGGFIGPSFSVLSGVTSAAGTKPINQLWPVWIAGAIFEISYGTPGIAPSNKTLTKR